MVDNVSANEILDIALEYDNNIGIDGTPLAHFICNLLDINNEDELFDRLDSLKQDKVKEIQEIANKAFVKDVEKMHDFFRLSREQFLTTYSYMSLEEYNATSEYWGWLLDESGFQLY